MAVAEEQQSSRMIHGQHHDGSLAHLVVVEVAAIGAGRSGCRSEIAGRSYANATQHRPRREFELHAAAGRFAQAYGSAGDVDIPGHDAGASLANEILLVLVGV